MDPAERSPDSIDSNSRHGDDVNVLDIDDDEMLAKTMSPRRNSEEMERFAHEAKERLERYVSGLYLITFRHLVYR
jgi:hypothetical protein